MTNDMENTIRELVALADTMGTTTAALVTSGHADAMAILARNLGPVTDSTIDDVTDALDDEDDELDWAND